METLQINQDLLNHFTPEQINQALNQRLKNRKYKTQQMKNYRNTQEGNKKVREASRRYYYKKKNIYHAIYNPTGTIPIKYKKDDQNEIS